MSDCNHCNGVRMCECDKETERQRFIRAAAIAIFAGHYDQESEVRAAGQAWTPEGAWNQARGLWNAKPEDC